MITETNTDSLPIMKLVGDVTGMSTSVQKVLQFTFELDDRIITGYTKSKWQGDTSTRWAKKNYKFKAFTDADCKNKFSFTPKADWASNHTFNLKANYIDFTQARNISNAKLFSEATATRPNVDKHLVNVINFGEIQGFPIRLLINDQDQGVYTFNTAKDEKLFGMDKSMVSQATVQSAQYTDQTRFTTNEAKFDGSDFSVEFPDTLTPELKTSFQNMMKFVNESEIHDFTRDEDKYLDIDSIIDFGIFVNTLEDSDMAVKNGIYATFDGQKWMMIPYDLDTSWQLQWDGKSIQNVQTDYFDFQGSRLLQKVFQGNQERVWTRYKELRKTALREDHVIETLRHFMQNVGQKNYEDDRQIWPATPSGDLTSFVQLQQAVYDRLKVSDRQVKADFSGGEVGHVANCVKNSDLIFDLSDWQAYGTFHRTVFPYSLGHGSAGISYRQYNQANVTWPSFQSKPIPYHSDNPTLGAISYAGNIYLYDDQPIDPKVDGFTIDVKFLDDNLHELSDHYTWANLNIIGRIQRVKAEHVVVPDGTKYLRFAYFAARNGHAIMTQPQLNLTPTLGEYSSNY